MILPIHQPRSELELCPASDYDAGDYQACSFSYDGELTLVRQDLVDETPPSEQPGQPAPGPLTPDGQDSAAGGASDSGKIDAVSDAIRDHLEQGQPQPQPAPPASPTDAKVDAVSKAIREYLQDADVSVTSRRAQVDLTCPGVCTGTVSASAVALDNAINGTPLGAATFAELGNIRAAATPALTHVRATLKLSKADRRALKRKRFVALTLRVKPAGVAAPVVVKKVVRAPRR